MRIPATISGSDAGRITLRITALRSPPKARTARISSGSTERTPASVLTTIDTTVSKNATVTTVAKPKPSHTTSSG